MRARPAEEHVNLFTAAERARLRALLDAVPEQPAGTRWFTADDEPAFVVALDYYNTLWRAWWGLWQQRGAPRPPRVYAFPSIGARGRSWLVRDADEVLAALRALCAPEYEE